MYTFLSKRSEFSESVYCNFHTINHFIHLIYRIKLREAEAYCTFNFFMIHRHSLKNMAVTGVM